MRIYLYRLRIFANEVCGDAPAGYGLWELFCV